MFNSLATDTSKGRTELRALAQANAHVLRYRAFLQTFGSMEGFYLNKARTARSLAQQMETPSGRAMIASRNANAAEWRASR